MIKTQRKSILLLYCLMVFLLLSGCGATKQTVEEDTEDNTLGFSAVRDYVVTITDGAVLYRTASTSGEVYITLNKGVNLRRTGYKSGWSRIRLNDALFYIEESKVKVTEMEWAKEPEQEENDHVVYIDPAKQIYANSGTEPLFYGESQEDGAKMKKKMSKGAIGTATGTFEYEITLSVAEKLRYELELRGYTVILSRTTSTVDLSNGERALAGNRSGAEILIRLQASASENPETKGIVGFVPMAEEGQLEWYQRSFALANSLITEICALTDSDRLGVYQTDGMTFINYARPPVAVIQMGFISNEEDDRNLSAEAYRDKLVRGLANGIDEYFAKEDAEKNTESKDDASTEADTENPTETTESIDEN